MPIDNYKGTKQVEFGTEDIKIEMGLIEEEKIGVIILSEKNPPGEIGKRVDYKTPYTKEAHEAPVRLLFTKIRSIDSLIRCLEDVKEKMVTGDIRSIKDREDPNV